MPENVDRLVTQRLKALCMIRVKMIIKNCKYYKIPTNGKNQYVTQKLLLI
jgi:hypothetical protein